MIYLLSIIGMGAVAFVLVLGLSNMARGGSANRSQRLMRLRIMLQAIAVVVVMTALYFSTRA
ncbi:MAG: twin transmembrane helix small protein [Pseudomonadota bacterium]